MTATIPCENCDGRGTKPLQLGTDPGWAYVCPVCNGSGRERASDWHVRDDPEERRGGEAA